MLTVIALLVGIIAGAVGTWVWLRTVSASRLRLAEDKRRAILLEAERESETTRREVQIEAREHAVKLRAEIEQRFRIGASRSRKSTSAPRSARPRPRGS